MFIFKGSVILDIAFFSIILMLPIPTTPFLIIFASNNAFIRFLLIYVAATIICISFFYYLGHKSRDITIKRNNPILKKLNKKLFVKKLLNIKKRAFSFAEKKLQNISVGSIIVLRTLGFHAALLSYASGLINASYQKNIFAAVILASIDVIFYWILVGSGRIFLNKYYPNLDLDKLINDHMFAVVVFFILLTYLFVILKILIKKVKIRFLN